MIATGQTVNQTMNSENAKSLLIHTYIYIVLQ